jgi:hypothetical protein
MALCQYRRMKSQRLIDYGVQKWERSKRCRVGRVNELSLGWSSDQRDVENMGHTNMYNGTLDLCILCLRRDMQRVQADIALPKRSQHLQGGSASQRLAFIEA